MLGKNFDVRLIFVFVCVFFLELNVEFHSTFGKMMSLIFLESQKSLIETKRKNIGFKKHEYFYCEQLPVLNEMLFCYY